MKRVTPRGSESLQLAEDRIYFQTLGFCRPDLVGMGTTQNPGGIMPPHMQQPRPMQMGVPQQQNPISLAPGGMMRRPM